MPIIIVVPLKLIFSIICRKIFDVDFGNEIFTIFNDFILMILIGNTYIVLNLRVIFDQS